MSDRAVDWRGLLRRTLATAAVIAAVVPFAGAGHAQEGLAGPGKGAPGGAPVAPTTVNLSALPNVAAVDIAAPPRVKLVPLTGASTTTYAADKAMAARGAHGRAPTTPALPPGSSTSAPPPTNSALLNIAGNAASDCGSLTPSDQGLAIGDGKNPIVQVNNDCISVWSPGGTRLLGPKTLQAFANLPAAEYVFDPRALYDWYNHRFIVLFGDSDLANNSYYDIAVSKSDDPTGSWYVYRFRTPTQNDVFNDFLRIGQDRQGVYLASNLFQMNGSCCGAYIYEEWVFMPKSQLYAGNLINYWYQSGMQANGQYTDSTQPANVWSPYDNPRAEFLVTSFNINYGGGNCINGCNGLVIWSLANPFGWINGGPNPEVSVYCCTGTSTYYLPPNASQPNGPNTIETLDTRITGAVTYNSGLLHAALTTGDNSWSDVLLYRIAVALGNEDPQCTSQYLYLCPRITSVGTYYESRLTYGGNFAYYPTPQPDLEGNVTTVFNFSGPNCAICYVSAGYISQRVTEPNNGFADSGLLIAIGRAFYGQFPWGRYTAVAPAGVSYAANGNIATPGVGFAGAYAKSDGSWGTQIGYATYTAPTQP